MLLVQMENKNHEQYPESGLPGVFEIPGEPAVVINGVPEAAPASDGTIICCNEVTDEKPSRTTNFGEWLEGREVRKLFGGQYFFGKVTMFDKDAGWYRVVYDDGDFEDLEWNELEQVLLPLDVTIPLKTLAMKMLRRSLNPTCTSPRKGSHTTKHSTSEVKKKATLSGGKRGRPRKVELENMEVSAIFSSLTEVPIVEKIEENSIPVVVIQRVLVEKAEVNGKSSGKRRGRPRKNQVERLDENARQTMLAGVLVDATFPGFTKGAHVEKVEEHGKPSGKKRGRPRKLEAVKVEEKESAQMTTAGALLENINGNINLSVFTEAASVEKVPEKQKPSGKKRGRPRKVQMEIVDSHAKLPVLTAGDSVEKPVESAKPAVALEEVEKSEKNSIVKFQDNGKLPVVIQDASVGKVGESGNLSGKKRGRPRKVQVEISEENAMLVVGSKRPLVGMVEVGMATDGETDCPRQLQARKSFNPSGRKRGRPRKLQAINVEQEVKQTSIVNAETLALVDKAAVVESVEQCEKL